MLQDEGKAIETGEVRGNSLERSGWLCCRRDSAHVSVWTCFVESFIKLWFVVRMKKYVLWKKLRCYDIIVINT